MGLFSWFFNEVGKIVEFFFGLILAIVVFILFFRGYSKFGDYKKLDVAKGEGYYEYTVKDYVSNKNFNAKFLNDIECTIDGKEYSYHFTKYLYCVTTGILGFETVLKDKNNGEERFFRIVQSSRIEEGSYYDAFLQGKEIPKNDFHVQAKTVDFNTWNEDREFMKSMEYEIMDSMVRYLMTPPSFIGILQ